MTIKKLLQSLLLLILSVGILQAQNGQLAKVKNGWLYEIPKTTIAPVIDGKQDAVWKTLDWNFQTSYSNGNVVPDSWADLFGASKLMWDDENLYGIFYSQDDIIVDVHNNSWERDAVEFYTDGNNSKGASYDNVDDIHIAFRHEFIDNEAANLSNINAAGLTNTNGIEFKIWDDTTSMGGYWVEFKIPLENLKIPAVPGTIIGLEWQQNDNDGTARESISKWWLQQGDNSWQEPRLFGTAVLSDRVVSDKFEIQKLPAGTTITIDGEMDAIYSQLNNITQNSHGNGNIFPVDFHDAFTRTYLAYDDENLYGLYIVYDDNIVDVHQNSWERDGVELYTDADNSKGSTFDNVNDIHIAFRHEFIDNEAANVSNLGWPNATWPTDGVEFKIVDTDLGYNVEFKIPIENTLQIPPVEGTVIGLEIQQNDNDGTSRESINKWWLEQGDNSWQQPNLWGTAVLGAPLVVGVKEKAQSIVTDYRLEQNYPNPFNPTTQITYSIPKTEKVRLTVYNVLGNEIAELVNETKDAGTYTVKFNAQNLASGVYFYQLNAGSSTLVRKMLLLK